MSANNKLSTASSGGQCFEEFAHRRVRQMSFRLFHEHNSRRLSPSRQRDLHTGDALRSGSGILEGNAVQAGFDAVFPSIFGSLGSSERDLFPGETAYLLPDFFICAHDPSVGIEVQPRLAMSLCQSESLPFWKRIASSLGYIRLRPRPQKEPPMNRLSSNEN